MSQKGRKGTGKNSPKDLKAGDSRGAQKGIRAKPVPKRANDK